MKIGSIKITYTPCGECTAAVELNGPGSTASFFQTFLTRTLNTIYPKTQRMFRPASEIHDLDFHRGPRPGLDREQELKLVNKRFYNNCLLAIEKEKPFFWTRPWYNYQARKYRLALETGSSSVYPYHHCTSAQRKDEIEKLPVWHGDDDTTLQ